MNNDDSDFTMNLPAKDGASYVGALSGEKAAVDNGRISVRVKANSGEIWLPIAEGQELKDDVKAPVDIMAEKVAEVMLESVEEEKVKLESRKTLDTVAEKMIDEAMENLALADTAKKCQTEEAPEASEHQEAFEKGRIAGLQEAILTIMEKNGPITEQMKKDVKDNVYHDSLINWIKSFR